MTEFLIPFLLMTRFPVNDIDVYHGPQYVFNVSRTYMEELHNNSIVHGQMIATMKCQNSGVTNLICKLSDFTERKYVEALSNNGTVESQQPRIESPSMHCNNIPLCDTFEMKFNKSGLQGLVINKNLANNKTKSQYKMVLKALVQQLNIFYINQYKTTEELFETKKNFQHDSVNVTIKIIREKLPTADNITKQFDIESIKGFDGFKYIYKVTRDFEKLKKKQASTLPNNPSDQKYQLISSIHRLIISPHHFISMNDEEVSSVVPNGKKFLLINKYIVTLHSIEVARNPLLSVVDPVYDSIY